jgi:retinol dehydrogenase-14
MNTVSAPTYLVTGATSGIGEAAAVQLVQTGAHVLLGARTAETGDAARRRIQSQVPEAEVDVVAADLSEMTQVRSLAEDVQRRIDRLDGLILNAGATSATRSTTSEGFSPVFATNYLSVFYLTRLLLPLLRESAPARIVVVSSSFHARIKGLDVDALTASQATGRLVDYEMTKLLDVLLVTKLAAQLHGSGLIVNTADPGFVRSNLGRNATGAFGLFLKAARLIQDTPDTAARILVQLATSPDITTSGGYYAKRASTNASALSQNRETATSLWEGSERLLSKQGFTMPAI